MFVMIIDFKEMTTCLWMSLDRCVSCMVAWRTTFTRWKLSVMQSGTWHWDATSMWTFWTFFATSLVLRCGIGSEMWTSNFKTTLHTVFGSCFRNKWACSLAVGLFSHCWIQFVDPRYVMLWRVVETCTTQPPSLLRKGKSGRVRAMEVVHIQEWNIMKHLERRRWGNKKIEES